MAVKVSKKEVWDRIYDKCRDCIYDPLDKGTCLAQIKGCNSSDCPLYPVRLGKYGEFPSGIGNVSSKSSYRGPESRKGETE